MKVFIIIEDFNYIFGIKFSDEEVDMVGGLVMMVFGYLFVCGEVVDIVGYNFKVIVVDSC